MPLSSSSAFHEVSPNLKKLNANHNAFFCRPYPRILFHLICQSQNIFPVKVMPVHSFMSNYLKLR